MDSYIGEVRIFTGQYAPNGWADCNGQLLSIQQYSTLFAVIGAIYGGDGRTTFALPNLNGRVPLHQGTGSGLTQRVVGQVGGSAAVTLDQTQMPAHVHLPQALDNQGSTTDPTAAVWAKTPKNIRTKADTAGFDPTPDTAMNAQALGLAGSGQPHNNMQPYVPLRFIISLEGVFPSRP
ncbi:phage tail protein [Massilia alkalitolerans]|uniref:phage tail protein n=1 Tax=Massilia alkalitolerans TaxID=286638 RepID=UPI00040556E2|nr:tail fiber protein [Massilia alkalitolerans]